ncbi:MAG: translocation/assembly module TamB [Bdellovibrionales bacterium]|nr:translocation/assembly module TamB [Bdellovibrionales bacterium]
MGLRKWVSELKSRGYLKFSLQMVIVAAFFSTLGFFYSYHLPRLQSWLLLEVEKQSEAHLPIRVWPESVELTYFPPGVSFKNVKLLPKDELKKTLAPAKIKSVSAYLSLLALFKGEVRASAIEIDKARLIYFDKSAAQTEAKAEEKTEETKPKPFKWISLMRKIPIDSFRIKDSRITAKSTANAAAIQAKQLKLVLENRFSSLRVEIEAPKVKLKVVDQEQPMNVSFVSKALIEKEGVQLTGVKLQSGGSFLVASGSIEGDTEKLRFKGADFNSRAFLDLNQIDKLTKTYFPKREIPVLQGSTGLEAKVSYNFKKKKWKGTVSAETKSVKVGRYGVGDTRLKGAFKDRSLEIKDVNINNYELKAKIRKGKITISEEMPMSFVATVNRLRFQPFMIRTLGLKKIPVTTNLSGKLPCKGQIKPNFKLECEGEVKSEGLHVYNTKEDGKSIKTIVKAPLLEAKGKVQVDAEKVTYQAKVKGGEKSTGESAGEISYKKGFNISFKADRLEMSDIENLADLKIEGSAVLAGTTRGTSKWGVFQMDLRAKKFWFENYALGQLNSQVRYKKGKLLFQGAKGQYLTSRYKGNVTVDFPNNQIFVTAQIPYLDLADLRKLMRRKYLLPVEIGGTGSGTARVWGPLQLNKMSLDLDSSFFRGEVAGESFDEFVLNASAKDGNLKTEQVVIKKAESRIRVNGRLNPEGNLDAVVVAKNFRLEQLEAVEKVGLDATGQLDATMSLKGPILRPEIILIGRLRKVLLGDTPTEDSSFEMEFLKQRIRGKGQLLGDQIRTSFSLPYDENNSFKFDLKTEELDFTNLFSLVSETAAKKDFKSKLTTQVSLHSDKGGIWSADGHIIITNFELRQGAQKLENQQPIVVAFNKGRISTKSFYLVGENSFLKLELDRATQTDFRSSMDAKLEMNLLSILTPFFSELRGRLALSVKTQGPIDKPTFFGSSFIDSGFLKLSAFPHAFEDTSADILFNKRDIIINALKSKLGGGDMRAQGKVVLKSLETVPVSIKGDIKGATLNVPEGVQTKGSGKVAFNGTGFPYTLSGNYDITEGNVTMEFSSSDDGTSGEIQPSQFLPKSIKEEVFEPLAFDLKINTVKPVKVNNSLLEATAEGNLAIKGTPNNLKFNGLLKPKPGGIISFRDTRFVIANSYVEYKQNSPEEPFVYVDANATVTETSLNANERVVETNYEINLLAQGQSPNLKINLKSQPQLSEQQIISLLALGVTTATTAVNDDRFQGGATDDAATGMIGTSIGAQLLGRQLGKPLKDRLGIDMTISTSVNPDNNTSSPRVILSKQWTPKWETSASRTIEQNPRSDFRLQYNVNDNLLFIGNWEGRENSVGEQIIQQNQIGVDLEFRKSFK